MSVRYSVKTLKGQAIDFEDISECFEKQDIVTKEISGYFVSVNGVELEVAKDVYEAVEKEITEINKMNANPFF